ncbi:MAG: DUF5666 domain-containing protein [Candidatus Electrothrix sp. YB6]
MYTLQSSNTLFRSHRNQCRVLFLVVSVMMLLLPLTSVQAAGQKGLSEEKTHMMYQGDFSSEREEVFFRGVVGSTDPLIVDGSEVIVSESTDIKGTPEVGSSIQIEGKWLSGSKFKAYHMQMQEGTDPGLSGEITGTVDEMPPLNWPYGIWKVEGRKIKITEQTVIKGDQSKAGVGSKITAKGSRIDGVFTASEFEIKATK